jgi:predicted PurR-regulated permease PerM
VGVPYPLLLGLWVAFTSFIPIFGTYIGVVPVLPLALAVSPTTALLAVLAYVLIQQLQDNILTPRVQGETAHVHPVVVLLVVLWVGWAFGLFWSVLAVPALVAVSALVDFLRARVRIRPDPPITP